MQPMHKKTESRSHKYTKEDTEFKIKQTGTLRPKLELYKYVFNLPCNDMEYKEL